MSLELPSRPADDQGRRVLVIGRSTLDVSVRSRRFAGVDEQIFVHEQRVAPGGSGANVSATLADLGEEVFLCSRVGADPAGRIVRDTLAERRISFGNMLDDPTQPTALSIIQVAQNGQMGLLHYEGANARICPNDVDPEILASARIVHIGGTFLLPSMDGAPGARLLAEARSRGAITSLSTSRNTQRRAVLAPMLPHLRYLFLNEKEAIEITPGATPEEAATWLRASGVGTVAITTGPRGAYLQGPGVNTWMPAVRVRPTDTTGCGDAFVGGFLFGLAHGLESIACARWGSMTAAHCARTFGALPARFDREEMAALMHVETFHPGLCALVLAGGRGGRMSGTNQKLALDLQGRPIVAWVVRSLRRLGVPRIVLLLGHAAEAIRGVMRGEPVEFLEPRESDLGTGGSLRAALTQIPELSKHFLVVNGDTPLLEPTTLDRLLKCHNESPAAATVCTAISPDPARYGHGVIARDAGGGFQAVLHHRRGVRLSTPVEVNTGTYCFDRDLLTPALSKLSPALDNHLHLSDVLSVLRSQGACITLLRCEQFDEFISANTPDHLAELRELIRCKRAKDSRYG